MTTLHTPAHETRHDMMGPVDLGSLPLDELRAVRAQLQHEDDVVSYVRRTAQVRLDLVRARMKGEWHTDDVADELVAVLSKSLNCEPGRPPRPEQFGAHSDPLCAELDELSIESGFGRLDELSLAELETLEQRLSEFERRVSDNRQARYRALDELSAELVRRYRDRTAADADADTGDGLAEADE